jgi:hypothetical protein
MDYGKLLSRSWNIIWEHKFLILLGVLVALGSGGGGGASAGSNVMFNQPPRQGAPMPEIPQIPDLRVVGPVVAVLAIIVALALVVIAVAVWVVSIIAHGGLIAGASTVDGGGSSSFVQAWNAGWRKGWRLLGIGVLPAIPAVLLAGIGVGAALVFGGAYRYMGRDFGVPVMSNLGILILALSCVLVPIALVLGLLQTFANRACMLEDLGVFGSYRRGVEVLFQNFGPAVVLFLIQIGIGIAIAIVGFLPGILLALCCVLWPLLILVQGAISAYFSTMWTLAWRRWTDAEQAEDVSPMAVG